MAERFLIKDVELPSGVPVPEAAKKRSERNEELKKLKLDAIKKRRLARRSVRHALKLRTLHHYKLQRDDEKQKINLRRQARAQGGFYKEPDAKVVFVIRIRGINKLAPKPKKILQLFRLRQLHNGVFIKVNKATTNMLRAVEPFVTYGYPSLSAVRQLIYKRGYVKIGKPGARQRVRIQCNDVISEHLGKHGIHGVEDMVHELYTCGPRFKEVSNFLWPFKLSSPRKGFVAKRHAFAETLGGDWGNREALINDLIRRMN